MISSNSQRETHEQYMVRMRKEDKRNKEIKMLKGSKATKVQVGGSHYQDFKIMPIE